jgi:hypothetical protein
VRRAHRARADRDFHLHAEPGTYSFANAFAESRSDFDAFSEPVSFAFSRADPSPDPLSETASDADTGSGHFVVEPHSDQCGIEGLRTIHGQRDEGVGIPEDSGRVLG